MYRKVQDMELKGKRVFIRVDFNVPLKAQGDEMVVTDLTRIQGALETIKYVIDAGGKVILASHLGRPKGKPEKKYSLLPVAQKLSEILAKDVILTEDCIGYAPKGLSQQMRNGDVILLENLRFYEGEEANAQEFAVRLAELCDVYISDAFGTLHRAHASTSALPKLIQNKGIGFLVQKELAFLEPLKKNPERPFGIIMGGSKVSDKIGVLEHFLDKVDKIFIGGAMAYAFLKAQGKEIGTSMCDDKQKELAAKILKSASVRNIKVYLPVDHVTSLSFNDSKNVLVTESVDIPKDRMGLDIGPKSAALYTKEMEGLKTIFWNGPMGVFENPAFSEGTFAIARALANNTNAKKLAGGGDSVAAIVQAGVEDKFDFISTGGGATLEYLEGQRMPGLEVLDVKERVVINEP